MAEYTGPVPLPVPKNSLRRKLVPYTATTIPRRMLPAPVPQIPRARVTTSFDIAPWGEPILQDCD
jgi:hypothetical protein